MNNKSKRIIFLTIYGIDDLKQRSIYHDLLKEFRDHGHEVTVVSPVERREKRKSSFNPIDGVNILKVRTLNITKSNYIEKTLGLLLLEFQYLWSIKNHLKNAEFDLILYSTPPITLNRVIEFLKVKYNAIAYLLLKDIFPQNAVDIALIRQNGIIHNFFRKKEKKLYEHSDYIGCMSDANVEYLLKHNPQLVPQKVEVNPNTIKPIFREITFADRIEIKQKYNIPVNKKIVVYGGNLGKPQGVAILPELIKEFQNTDTFFLIIGSGTEYRQLHQQLEVFSNEDVVLIASVPLNEYEVLISCASLGLILLDGRFTIPNFPSRLLSYLEMRVPVLCITDSVTDIGHVLKEAGCGEYVNYYDLNTAAGKINKMLNPQLNDELKINTRKLLESQFGVYHSYLRIIEKI